MNSPMRCFPITLAVGLAAAGCATTGATFGSGVGDTSLERPPYYAGARPADIDPSLALGHLPIVYQRGASQPAIFDPSLSGPVADLLAEMTRYLDSLAVIVRLVEGARVSAVTHADTRHPPDVRFGCPTDTGFPDDDCAERDEDDALGRGYEPLMLSVGRPSAGWTLWMADVMADQEVDRALVVTLEIGQYWIRQRGLRGAKEVPLGTDHVARLPWLTSLEGPVAVVQLTGALVGPDGRAVRIGAEGLMAKRTGLPISALEGQALVTDDDVRALLDARRDDLPGRPLVWQEGLRTLVAQLTGRTVAGAGATAPLVGRRPPHVQHLVDERHDLVVLADDFERPLR